MKVKKILTIESDDDLITRNMLKALYSSLNFNQYEIDHIFGNYMNEPRNLFRVLNEKIRTFKPDVILIHTGKYFNVNLKVFMQVIPQIKSKHRNVKFGIAHRYQQSKEIASIIDNDEDVVAIEKKFFLIDR